MNDAFSESNAQQPAQEEQPKLPLDPVNAGVAAAAVAAAVSVGVGAFVIPPSLEAVEQGQAPPNTPQPGTFGGGGQPINSNPTALEALSLTPLGLVPVAIFPPWAKPRAFPAVAVIFSESPANGGSPIFLARKFSSELSSSLRSFSRRHYRKKPRKSGIEIWKEIIRKKFNRIRIRSRCVAAKVVRAVTEKFRSKKGSYWRNRKPLKECQEFREPLYGFRVKVKLVQNQRCFLGVTCTEDGRKIRPETRTETGTGSVLKDLIESLNQLVERLSRDHSVQRFPDLEDPEMEIPETEIPDQLFLERQTGESFFSAAPVDCRTSKCPDNR